MIANSKAKSRYANMKFLLACLVVVLSHGICAFQLSMVASRAPFGGGRKFDSATTSRENSYTQNRRQPVSPHKPTSVTDSFISSLACAALKRRLKDQTHVSCDATMDPSSLFSGKVGPVTVKGRGWASSLGLTARALEATVDECQLDMARILTNQKLVLTTPGMFCCWNEVVASCPYVQYLTTRFFFFLFSQRKEEPWLPSLPSILATSLHTH